MILKPGGSADFPNDAHLLVRIHQRVFLVIWIERIGCSRPTWLALVLRVRCGLQTVNMRGLHLPRKVVLVPTDFQLFNCTLLDSWTQLRSWLRHYATSRKVTASFPDEVTGFFNWPIPSSRNMTLELTQPLTKWVAGIFLGIKGGWPAREAENLTAICEPVVQKMWKPRRLTTLWVSTVC
jgi:hypothetical protein